MADRVSAKLLPEVPAEVTGDQMAQMFEVLGVTVPLGDIRRMVIDPNRIVLTVSRRRDDGILLAIGNSLAEIEVGIGIRWTNG